MVAIVALLACLPLVALSVLVMDRNLRSESRFQSSKLITFCEWGSAWLLGLIFLSGGLSKLMPFPGVIGPVWLEEALAEYGLGHYARFIAWSEALIGLLLLSKQTRVLGAIMLVPMLSNILMVTVSLQWRGTPWVIVFFLANNVFLLAYHFNRWRPIIDLPMNWLTHRTEKQLVGSRIVSVACIIAVGLAPFLHKLHWVVSTAVVIVSFTGLLWAELVTRFRTCVDEGPQNVVDLVKDPFGGRDL